MGLGGSKMIGRSKLQSSPLRAARWLRRDRKVTRGVVLFRSLRLRCVVLLWCLPRAHLLHLLFSSLRPRRRCCCCLLVGDGRVDECKDLAHILHGVQQTQAAHLESRTHVVLLGHTGRQSKGGVSN